MRPKLLRRAALTTPNRRTLLKSAVSVAAVGPALPRLAHGQNTTLNVYNWDTYIGEDTLDNFTDSSGIAVRYDLYADNDELFAKLREGNPGYDVIFPSNDYIERMITAEMLVKLDHTRIPNIGNLGQSFLDAAFDPGREHSMTYFWGTQGIGFRQSAMERPESFAVLYETPEALAGRIALLRGISIIQSGQKYLGYSVNEAPDSSIDEVAQLLIANKGKIKAFAPDNGQDLLIAYEVDACMEYNGDILQVMEEDDDLSYTVPREGALMWEDAMCIPAGAPNVEAAHEFINFILQGETHAAIANEVRYPCPNEAAKEFISEQDLNNPALYPPQEVIERCEVPAYQGIEHTSRLEEALTRVLAA